MEATKGRVLCRSAALIAGVAALTFPSTALAISNGVPDGNRHPNVGLLTVEEGGHRFFGCSGSYAGAHKRAATTGVFLTAGHCVADLPALGISASRLWVTFDSTVTIDPETGEVTAETWYQGAGFAFDPAFGHDRSNLKDYAVVLLSATVPVAPIQLPAAGLLDQLTARGGLRPGATFDNVGYGAIPSFKTAPPAYAPPPGRMLSTSRFQALTGSWLKLLMNSDASDGNGGVCFGDSGSPHLVHQTNTAVAVTSGGDAVCRAENHNQRLDVPDARAFLGEFLRLP
jgi:Trypsin